MADCATGRLKAGRADIVTAVHGRVTSHHRFLLQLHLAQIDALIAAVQQVEHQADEVLRPFREAADGLTTMPGVSETVARVIISEIGVDMTRGRACARASTRVRASGAPPESVMRRPD